MVQDKRNGRIFLAVDMQLDAAGLWKFKHNSGDVTTVNKAGETVMKLYHDTKDSGWTMNDQGDVFNEKGNKTQYHVIIQGDPAQNFRNLGDIYDGNTKVGNIYLRKTKPPFNVADTGYIWLTHSDDNGKTWSSPVNISNQFKEDWMKFIGVGPGVGIQTKNGNLVIPIYFLNKQNAEMPAVIISSDGGKTWTRSKSPQNAGTFEANTERINSTDRGYTPMIESQLVELDNGDLKLFTRNSKIKRRKINIY